MPTTAKLRHLRIAPRKVRLLADLIRGKSVEQAQNILSFTTKRASEPLLKLLKSGISSAKNQFGGQAQDLYISKITVDEGPKLKRWMPRARGSAYEIQKKTSHVTLILDTINKKHPTSERGRGNPQVSPYRKTGRPKSDRQKPRVSGERNFRTKMQEVSR